MNQDSACKDLGTNTIRKNLAISFKHFSFMLSLGKQQHLLARMGNNRSICLFSVVRFMFVSRPALFQLLLCGEFT